MSGHRAGLAAARALLADASISVSDVAQRLNVAVSTFYRHLPAARAIIKEWVTPCVKTLDF